MPEIDFTMGGFMAVSSIYIGLNALIMFVLAFLVVRARGANFKSGGSMEAARDNRIRAHSNNTEYVPMALLLLVALEFQGAPIVLLHGLGILLTVSRIGHGYGRGKEDGRNFGRFWGTVGTWLTFLIGGVAVLYFAFI